MPWRTAAMTAASLALSVVENRLLVSTCAVSAGSCAARVAVGKLCKPALVNWGFYSFMVDATWVPRRAGAIAPIGIRRPSATSH